MSIPERLTWMTEPIATRLPGGLLYVVGRDIDLSLWLGRLIRVLNGIAIFCYRA
jgi:hypothetical protein